MVGLDFPQSRPTRDIDLLGLMNSDLENVSSIIKEIGNKIIDDGLTFDLDGLNHEILSQNSDYPGLRSINIHRN